LPRSYYLGLFHLSSYDCINPLSSCMVHKHEESRCFQLVVSEFTGELTFPMKWPPTYWPDTPYHSSHTVHADPSMDHTVKHSGPSFVKTLGVATFHLAPDGWISSLTAQYWSGNHPSSSKELTSMEHSRRNGNVHHCSDILVTITEMIFMKKTKLNITRTKIIQVTKILVIYPLLNNLAYLTSCNRTTPHGSQLQPVSQVFFFTLYTAFYKKEASSFLVITFIWLFWYLLFFAHELCWQLPTQ